MNGSLQHSAEVDIYFLIDNKLRIEIAGCLQTKCTLRNPINLPRCYADLVTIIDGKKNTHRVLLKHGISSDSVEVEFDNVNF